MIGAAGDDVYLVDSALDVVIETAAGGHDVVYAATSYALAATAEVETLSASSTLGTASIDLTGSAFANRMLGNVAANAIHGGGGDDLLFGFAGDDTLDGGTGHDLLFGGLGNDSYIVNSTRDVVSEARGQGYDRVFATVSHALAAGSEVEVLATTASGGTAAVILTGNEYANLILGNAGNNVLRGLAGNDTLAGGLGNDTLAGGTGRDTFLFNSALDAAANVDAIVDFNASDDTIRLDNAIFTRLGAGMLASGAFVIGTAARDYNDHIIYDDLTGALLYDADGNGAGAAIEFARLAEGLALTSRDFLVV
jgi:Ca2+-binding RTX toxin-like protein